MTAVYTTQTVNMLANALGVSNNTGSNIAVSKSVSGDSTSITSSIATIQADMGDAEFAHRLILKDRLEGGAHIMSMVTITNDTLGQITEYLKQTQDNLGLLSNVIADSDEYNSVLAAIDEIELEMSSYLGSLFHKGTLDFELNSGDPTAAPSFLDFINLYEDPSNPATLKGQIAALEVDMVTLSHATHHPDSCPHCSAQAVQQPASTDMLSPLEATVSNSSSAGGVGYNSNSAATTADPNYEEINTLLLSTNWDVGAGELLSYSYFTLNNDGTNGYPSTSAYNVSGVDIDTLTESNVDDATADPNRDTNNSTYLNQAFGLWDDIVDFNFEEITEASTNGSLDVGEMRVAFTDRSSSAAAFAIQPGNGVPNGDVWFEAEDNTSFNPSFDFTQFGQDSDDDGIADLTAVVSRAGLGDSGYSFRSAMHEIGHAIGLSHPFDNSSFTGSTLPTSKDLMRNTIMSYTNLDRNSYISFSTLDSGQATLNTWDYQDYSSIDMTGASYTSYGERRIYASTPMVYDVEAAQYMYAEEQTSGQGRDGNNAYAYDDKVMVIQTIVDSGGTDTIDASRVTRDSIINLTPGSFSSIGIYSRADQLADIEAQTNASVRSNVSTFMSTLDGNAATGDAIYTGEDNVAISTKTYIENATGGSGDDTITGNHLNNTIIGGAGNDTIDGGDGDGDIAYFSGKQSDYTITGSGTSWTVTDNNTADGDDGTDTLTNIEFLSFGTSAASSAQVLADDDFELTFNTDLSGESASDLQFYLHNKNWDNKTAPSTSDAVQVQIGAGSGITDFSGLTKSQVLTYLQQDINAALTGGTKPSGDIEIDANSPLRFTTNGTGTNQTISIWGLSTVLQNFFGFNQADLRQSAFDGNISGVGTSGSGDNRIYVDPNSPLVTYYVPTNLIAENAVPSGGYTISASSVSGYGTSGGGVDGGGDTGDYLAITVDSINRVFAPKKNIGMINISTAEGAFEAIEMLDVAIQQISAETAKLGAIQNRLTTAISNLRTQAIQTETSKSRIVDTDFTVELTKLVKKQILSQAASQILNQSNSSKQNVLGLL